MAIRDWITLRSIFGLSNYSFTLYAIKIKFSSCSLCLVAVSDLDAEFRMPAHLHYRASDSVEEDLFTTDSRTPCLIHLHQQARSVSMNIL